jgi:hypothetical protein
MSAIGWFYAGAPAAMGDVPHTKGIEGKARDTKHISLAFRACGLEGKVNLRLAAAPVK